MPDAPHSAGPQAVRLAESAGVFLDRWQADAVSDLLRYRDDGLWAAFEGAILVARQNGKGEILLVRELAGLYLLEEDLILHSAHEFKTAKEAYLRIRGVIETTPELLAEVKHRGGRPVGFRSSNEEVGIELRSGQRLRFVARSSGSGRGFTGDCVILDEAYNLSLDMMAALLPTLSAVPNSQLIYASSAPLPKEESSVLRSVCRRGRAGESPSLAYLEWCAADDAEPKDRQAWAEANPAYPARITDAAIERELEAFLADPELGGEESFIRERLGVWHDLDVARERVIDPAAWEACEDTRSEITGRLSFGFAVAVDRRSAAIAVAGKRADGLTHLELVEHRRGVDWLVPRLLELRERWKDAAFIADAKGPSGAHVEDAQQAGLQVTEATLDDYKRACSSLYDDVTTSRVRHIGQPALNAAIDGAGRRDVNDAWLWSRQHSAADISPLEAVTLAKSAADNQPTWAGPMVRVR